MVLSHGSKISAGKADTWCSEFSASLTCANIKENLKKDGPRDS